MKEILVDKKGSRTKLSEDNKFRKYGQIMAQVQTFYHAVYNLKKKKKKKCKEYFIGNYLLNIELFGLNQIDSRHVVDHFYKGPRCGSMPDRMFWKYLS